MALTPAEEDLLRVLERAEKDLKRMEKWCGDGMPTGSGEKVWNCIGGRLEKIRTIRAELPRADEAGLQS